MQESVVKGIIVLSAHESALKADLLFTSDPDGEEWNKDKIKQLLSGNNITNGIIPDGIEKALKTFAASKENETTVTIAAGNPPELPVPEEVVWEELPIPDEYSNSAEKVLEAAANPQIERIIFEKIKVKKKVLKKSKIPFAPPKEEIIIVEKKKEVREKVDIDNSVVYKGWTDSGTKIGAITASKPGKPGKDIYGKQILPESDTESAYYHGTGITCEKGVFTAGETGFIRRGSNWIDIIPFKPHTWELKLSKDKVSCYLDFEPGSEGSDFPDVSAIVSEYEKLECDKETMISASLIETALKNSISEKKSLTGFSMTGDFDSFFKIDINEDKTKGTLTVCKGRGKGKLLILKEVGAAIKKSGFKGMNLEKIKKDLLDYYKGNNFELKDYILAEGSLPAKAPDRKIQYKIKFLPDDAYNKIRTRCDSMEKNLLEEIPSGTEFPLSAVEKAALIKKDEEVAVVSEEEKGEGGKDIFGEKHDGLSGDQPDIRILENIKMEKNSIKAEIDGILEILKNENQVILRVRPHQDCKIDVSLSEDMMSAYLNLKKSTGSGIPISLQEVNRIISENNIKKGIKSDQISNAIEKAQKGEDVSGLIIAEGIPPVVPSSYKLKFNIKLATGKKVIIKEDGSADYKTRDDITPVKVGECIAEILKPVQEAKAGWNIAGKELPAEKPVELELEIGENIQEEEIEGAIRLVAKKGGELLYDKKKIDISAIHAISGDVGLKTGNIKYPGDVNISGKVQSGFYVMSGGDVLITENVEAALISSDGNIAIGQGIKGGNKAILRAKKDIHAGFAEYATLLSVKDIKIKNSCLKCNIKCNGKLTLETEKGNLVGGVIKATNGIEAANIGSSTSPATKISFGQNYLVADQIELEEKEIEKLKNRIIKCDISAKDFEENNLSEKLEQTRQEKVKAMKIMEKRSMRLFLLKERFEEHFPGEVKIRGTIFPGVIFECHGRFHEITTEKKGIIIYFDPELGHIQEKPIK